MIRDVGARDAIHHVLCAGVHDELPRKTNGAREADFRARCLFHVLGSGQEDVRHTQRARQLGLVHLVVPADDGHHHVAPRDVEQALQESVRGSVEKARHLFDAALFGRVHLGDRGGFFRVGGPFRGGRSRHFEVCGVGALGASRQEILAALDQDLKLGASGSAHGAAVRAHHPVREAHAIEDGAVCATHRLVALLRRLFVDVEGVRVLHAELATAKQAAAGSSLVTKLGLDLVQVLRQIAVALDLAACEIRDDLFVRRPQVVVRAFSILEPKQDVAEHVPAPRLSKVFTRQESR